MKPQCLMSCKGWIQALYPEKKEALASLLSPADARLFHSLPDPLPFDAQRLHSDPLDGAHPTWIAPFLRTLSSGEIPLFLSALEPKQAEVLAETLGYSGQLPPLRPIATEGLRKIMRGQLTYGFDLVPQAFLPQSPLHILLDLSSTELSLLLRFLGLHDLAFEMRQIISTQKIKQIFGLLSQKEGKYLNGLLIHKEPLVFERLFLEKWDGSQAELHKLLDTRGLSRLGHAIYSEGESFIWHLTHRLDIHRGALLLKYRRQSTHTRAEEILIQQIKSIVTEAL